MTTQYAKALLRFRWLVMLGTLIVVAIASMGFQYFSLSNDYRQFFSSDNPQLQAFENLQNTFNKSDNVMFIVTPKDGKVFTPETLASIQWLTHEAWQTPYSSRVDSITNFQHTKAIEDDLEVADLVGDPTELSENELLEIQNIAVNEPQLIHRIINAEASVTGVNVTIQLPEIKLTEAEEVAAFARDLAAKMEARDSNIEVRLTGIIMMNNAFSEAAQNDMASLVPAMFVVVLIVLGLMLRSISLTFATLILIIFSIVGAMGIFMWTKTEINPMVMSAPTIIMTMAVADAVHLLSTYLWNGRQGMNKHDAMVESLRINMMPIFLTSITTAVGFLSMNFSEVPPINHLGNIVAIGVSLAFIFTVTFLPAAAMFLPFTTRQADSEQNTKMDALASFVIDKRKPLLWGTLAISVTFIAMLPQNEINDEFVKYFDESVDFRRDTVYASENLIGPYTIEYAVSSKNTDTVADPDYLSDLEAFSEHLKTYEETSHVFTLTDTMKKLNQNMHGDDPDYYSLPKEQNLAAQYLLLYEMSLPYGLDLNNQIDINKSSSRVVLTTENLSSQQVLSLEASINTWLAENKPNLRVDAGSPNLMFAHIGQRNAKSLVIGTGIALIFISFALIAALRSFKIGLISLIPNLVPAGVAFGIWAIIDGNIGMSVSIVAGMTLGIVVDDSVHFLSKYLRARREKGLDAAAATRYAFNNVGMALIITTVVLVIGFLVLTLSTFKVNSDMGLVTALTIAIALFIDFLLLPPLLMLFDKKEYPKPKDTTATLENEDNIAAAPAS